MADLDCLFLNPRFPTWQQQQPMKALPSTWSSSRKTWNQNLCVHWHLSAKWTMECVDLTSQETYKLLSSWKSTRSHFFFLIQYTLRLRTHSLTRTTSCPRTTRPKTECLLSKWGVPTVVMKNCEPFELGPAFAMDNVNGSCFRLRSKTSCQSRSTLDQVQQMKIDIQQDEGKSPESGLRYLPNRVEKTFSNCNRRP